MPLLLLLNFSAKLAALPLFPFDPRIAFALWFVPDALLAYHLFAPHAQGLVTASRHFAPQGDEVWLTIDDGPDPDDTPRILELLARHRARATFFLVGQRAAAHPQLVRAILAAGHEVAHHTHTHPLRSFWCASRQRVARELDAGLTALRALGAAPVRFRPPAGIKNLWLAGALSSRGLTCIGWSSRGLECWSQSAESVARRLTRDLAPGKILLLHEGPGVPSAIRIRAIQLTLEILAARGYRCVVPSAQQAEAHAVQRRRGF